MTNHLLTRQEKSKSFDNSIIWIKDVNCGCVGARLLQKTPDQSVKLRQAVTNNEPQSRKF